MRIQWFQHVPFEGLGKIEEWASTRGHTLGRTRFFEGEPAPVDYDMLIVMGGPMEIADEASHPWLRREKAALRKAIDSGKPVIGICLGAQLIAEALGARVFRIPAKEVGWFPVTFTGEARTAFPDLPGGLDAFHWHGETFGLPEGAVHLASSEACANQAFLHENRVLALQFHLEVTTAGVQALARECPNDLVPGPFTEDREAMLADTGKFSRVNLIMEEILDAIAMA